MRDFLKLLCTLFLIFLMGLSLYLFVLAFGPVHYLAGAKWQLLASLKEEYIPHKIHYVWLGSQSEPAGVQKAIASWKEFLPDWEIKRWDESNCPIANSPLASKALQEKKYQWASDFCRLYALEKEGGLYFDTDLYLKNSPENLLHEPLSLVLETGTTLSGGIFAVVPHHPFIKRLLKIYQMQEPYKYLERNKSANVVKNPDKTEEKPLVQEFDEVDKNYFPIPEMMTRVFNEMYDGALMRGVYDLKGVYVIHPVNRLMLDFGGPENSAEHFYANGDSGYTARSKWYHIFARNFLENNAFIMKNTDNEAYLWFIPIWDNRGYFVAKQDDERYFALTQPVQLYRWHTAGDVLYLTGDNGEKSIWYCQNKVCRQKDDFEQFQKSLQQYHEQINAYDCENGLCKKRGV